LAKSEKAIKFMIPTPKIPMVDANWRGVNLTNVLDEGLRIGEIGRWMNLKIRLVEIGVCWK
jgi:hypothetical protein